MGNEAGGPSWGTLEASSRSFAASNLETPCVHWIRGTPPYTGCSSSSSRMGCSRSTTTTSVNGLWDRLPCRRPRASAIKTRRFSGFSARVASRVTSNTRPWRRVQMIVATGTDREFPRFRSSGDARVLPLAAARPRSGGTTSHGTTVLWSAPVDAIRRRAEGEVFSDLRGRPVRARCPPGRRTRINSRTTTGGFSTCCRVLSMRQASTQASRIEVGHEADGVGARRRGGVAVEVEPLVADGQALIQLAAAQHRPVASAVMGRRSHRSSRP
jgi:hypothetical protein